MESDVPPGMVKITTLRVEDGKFVRGKPVFKPIDQVDATTRKALKKAAKRAKKNETG